MTFNSYPFILAFLPTIIFAYFLLGKINPIIGKVVIVFGSLFFYAYSDVEMIKIICFSLAINFTFAKIIEKKTVHLRLYVICPIIINVLTLLFFKYTRFAVENINIIFGKELGWGKNLILPIGISFFTFQQISYVVAVYRKEIERVSLIDYASYILYFPKLLMGPLMEPLDFLEQYNDSKLKTVNWDNIACGIKLFSFGLIKKVLLADTFAKVVNAGFECYDEITALDTVIVMLFYTFQIYFDFSGYTDMAVGVSAMLNITLPMNFDSPYKALSIRDFWKRWHISLTKFLTKYIYIPLGGSRKGLLFTCLNTMIVFLVSGIWHGANWTFIVWGLLHGLLSVVERLTEKYTEKILKPIRWIVTFLIVNVLWLLFRADSVVQWKDMLGTIVSFSDLTISEDLITAFSFPETVLLTNIFPFLREIICTHSGIVMGVFSVIAAAICFFPENNYRTMKKLTYTQMILAGIFFIWGITCLGSEAVFVYFNF